MFDFETSNFWQPQQTTPDNDSSWSPPAASTYSGWFVDTQKNSGGQSVASPQSGGDSWWDDVWKWATSDKGLGVIGGTADRLYKAYQDERNADERKRLYASGGGGGGGGPSAAELQDARIKVHNASINKPMSMGMLKLKR